MRFERSRGDNFAWNYLFKLKKFHLFWVTPCQLSSNTTEIKITLFEDFETFQRANHYSLRKCKELKRFFFQAVLPTPSSFHRQSQRHIFVFSKPNNTNTATTGLHNHAVFWNGMKQQQTGHILLMLRATWTSDFLNQQAVFTAMKSRAQFLISN